MTTVVSKSLCDDRDSECEDENGPRQGLNPEAPSIKARATWDTWAGAPLYAAPISLYHNTAPPPVLFAFLAELPLLEADHQVRVSKRV